MFARILLRSLYSRGTPNQGIPPDLISQTPLLQGDSAAGVNTLVLHDSQNKHISLLLNSVPLSDQIFLGAPKIDIQAVVKDLIMVQ